MFQFNNFVIITTQNAIKKSKRREGTEGDEQITNHYDDVN